MERAADRNIQIRVTDCHPPTGEMSTDGGLPCQFGGWLQLLRLLSEVLAPAQPGAEPSA